MGVEIIAVTAGEAEHPEVTIPRAMRSIVWRLILFYVAAIAIMVTMVPWNQSSSSSTGRGSPFVTVFVAAHIPFAATHHEFRGVDRGAFQREYESLSVDQNALLSGSGRLCPALDGQS